MNLRALFHRKPKPQAPELEPEPEQVPEPEPVPAPVHCTPFPESDLARVACDFLYTLDLTDQVRESFAVLDQLKMEDGYVLDEYVCESFYESMSEFYAHKSDAVTPYVPFEGYEDWDWGHDGKYSVTSMYKDDMIITKPLSFGNFGIPNWMIYLEVPWTEMGVWQAFLLWDISHRRNLGWHGLYMQRKYIFSFETIQELATFYEPFPDGLADQILACKDDERIIPQVRIDGDVAYIRLAFWTNWGGLKVKEYRCRRSTNGWVKFSDPAPKDLEVEDTTEQILVEFDCGICY